MAGCATAPTDRQTPAPQPEPVAPAAPAATAPQAVAEPAPVASVVPRPSHGFTVEALQAASNDASPDVGSPAGAAGTDGAAIGAEALAGNASHTVAGLTPEQYPDVFDRIRAGFK